MHARYCSPYLGRFLGVDPKRQKVATRNPKRWNRFAYAIGNPIKFIDPDGKDVIYAHEKDRKFYEKRALRNSRVRAVLTAFAPGSGRDLIVSRGDPGVHSGSGTKRGAVTTNIFREPTAQELRDAYTAAGEGEAGNKAVAVLLGQGRQLKRAEITLGPRASNKDKVHELGHVEQALVDPEQHIADVAEAEKAPTVEDYNDSDLEQYADDFAEEALENDTPKRDIDQ